METKLLSNSTADLQEAAHLLKEGNVVGIPTETVYGLAADARNPEAVRQIFAAKGRPADNPLIVHIAKLEELESVAVSVPELALKLAEKFWPGPLTMILPKHPSIPAITSGGLDTVGVRMPSHLVARKLIELSGVPIAAPSANISGYPSPTTAQHVMRDMHGKIAAVVDGGDCCVGVESTVIALEGEDSVRILRPGYVTKEMLEARTDMPVLAISARQEQGVELLEEQIKSMFFAGELSFNDEVYITNVRHKTALEEAYQSLTMVENSIAMEMPEDFFSIDLMNAYEALGRIVGESVGEDLVNEIFSKFCTGK